jgi:hypothetical protein
MRRGNSVREPLLNAAALVRQHPAEPLPKGNHFAECRQK